MTRTQKIQKLHDDAQARIDAGTTTPSDQPHIERGRVVYGSKEQRTVNACRRELGLA